MSQKKKYQLFIALAVVLFVYVVATEVADRIGKTFRLYAALEAKEQSMLKPEALAEKRVNLISRKRALTLIVTKGAGTYEQNETGVFEYLNASAKKTDVRFESLVPIDAQTNGQIKEVGFKLNFSTQYHHAGAFLNTVETGAMLVRMRQIEIALHSVSSSTVEVNAEGIAYIVPAK
jgi:Tfp pilus assembly protein PilO